MLHTPHASTAARVMDRLSKLMRCCRYQIGASFIPFLVCVPSIWSVPQPQGFFQAVWQFRANGLWHSNLDPSPGPRQQPTLRVSLLNPSIQVPLAKQHPIHSVSRLCSINMVRPTTSGFFQAVWQFRANGLWHSNLDPSPGPRQQPTLRVSLLNPSIQVPLAKQHPKPLVSFAPNP